MLDDKIQYIGLFATDTEANMATNLINPDVKLFYYNNDDVPTTPCAHKNGEPDSDLDCPYDGKYCRQKEARIKAWARAIEYHAEHKIDNLLFTSADMFENCPLHDQEYRCVRKIRYEAMQQTIKHHVK